MRVNKILFFLCLTSMSVAHAYTDQDETTMHLRLDPTWHIIGQQNDPKTTITAYFNGAVGSTGESIMQTTTKKTAGKSAVDQVQQMFDDMKVGITQRGCTMGELREMSAPANTYRKWTTEFQCKMPSQSGNMIIVDADPVNLYTFTYNSKNENLLASTAVGEKLINESAQVCYKGKTCYMI